MFNAFHGLLMTTVLDLHRPRIAHMSCIAVAALSAECMSTAHLSDPERAEQVVGIDKHSTYPAVRRIHFPNQQHVFKQS